MTITESADRAAQIVQRAIAEFNAAEGAQVPSERDTVLLGAGGAIDSLGLVRLVLLVERHAEEDSGAAISLTDEKAMSQRSSPFRTVGSLIDYLAGCLREVP